MKAVWIRIPIDSLTTQSRHPLCVCSANQRTGQVSEWLGVRGVPSSGPALVGGQTAADNGQAGRGQRPQGCPPELLQQRTSLLGPAGLAPFFRHPHPSEAASPPPTTPSRAWVPLPRPRRRAQPSPLRHPGPGAEAHSGKKQGWGIYFFSPFLFFNKKN